MRTLKETELRSRSSLFTHLSASFLISVFVLVLCQFPLDALKGVLVDAMFRSHWWSKPSPAVVLIAYDDASSVGYEEDARIPPEELNAVFRALAPEKPLAVGVVATLTGKTYSDAELAGMSQSFALIPHSYAGFLDDELLGRSQPTELHLVGRFLPGFVSRDTFSYGMDSVTRRVMISVEGFPTIYAKMACLYHKFESLETCLQHQHYEKLGDSLQTYINWQGTPGTYSTLSSREVATGRFPPGTFAGKMVLFGSKLTANRSSDFILTPFSRQPLRTSLLEGAAHGLVTLMDNTGISKLPNLVNIVLCLILGLTTVNLALLLSPGRGILFVASEVIVLWLTAYGLLFFAQTWMSLAHPLICACASYYLVVPYRLVDEYRKRWHYQEKSELMAQLEQLKSNFLSLVSHDLKTPVARIQGNAELLLNESSQFSERQKKFVEAILHTTEDLGQYVEMVLDLTRIESSQVPIQKQTKDLNAVIQEIIENRNPQASEAGIRLVSELEPLFSFKFDARLIRRVLSNIVENAIKYSPPNSVVKITSKEDPNWIRVSITDQGVGIPPEEQEKVFAKFYRCDNDKTRENKGTGLGLYLVKYFVELHEGIIELKSELGKGSTFTVSLPV